MKPPLKIAIAGLGTVGAGVVQLLQRNVELLERRGGRRLVVSAVAARDRARARGIDLSTARWCDDAKAMAADPEIDVVVELIGGSEGVAHDVVTTALAHGKHVVTANKALLAHHGTQFARLAEERGVALAFEAAVAGGIPILKALREGLAANNVARIYGILNGTCNFILTRMSESGQSYADALAEAQRRGYAESDPTLDVNGTDSAHKLAILVQIAFGLSVPVHAIDRRGIADLDALDIRFARELGYTIKLLAETWLMGNNLALHVSPVLLRRHAPLAMVRGAYNAIFVVGDVVGDALFAGQGAGQMPTASAVVADIIDLAVGRAQRTFTTLKLWSGQRNHIQLQPSSAVRSRFYLRLFVEDRPGVLADVTRVLAQHQISIASVIQHEAPEDHEGGRVHLVIMTHTALTGDFRAAVTELDRLDRVAPPSVYYPVGD